MITTKIKTVFLLFCFLFFSLNASCYMKLHLRVKNWMNDVSRYARVTVYKRNPLPGHKRFVSYHYLKYGKSFSCDLPYARDYEIAVGEFNSSSILEPRYVCFYFMTNNKFVTNAFLQIEGAADFKQKSVTFIGQNKTDSQACPYMELPQ